MLEAINVKNLALIKESEVPLGEGLNILTGETGAGKSIILGSVRLALGERAKGDIIRKGADYALIELSFSGINEAVFDKMRELDLPIDGDSIIISRKISEGRSVCKCNGETISGRDLKAIAGMLINIHGQNDTQSLLDVANYMDILDDYAGDELIYEREKYSTAYNHYRELCNELSAEEKNDGGRDREISLAQFELEEIKGARLDPGEDVELEEKFRLMMNMERITETLSRIHSNLNGEGASLDLIGYSLRELGVICALDDRLAQIEQNLSAGEEILMDVSRALDTFMDSLDFSREEYEQVQGRLDSINRLKKKYGNSIEDILDYAKEREEYIRKMENFDAYISKLRLDVDRARKESLRQGHILHSLRAKAGESLREKMLQNLKELNFNHVEFDIIIEEDEENPKDNGLDTVDFKVSFNLGEAMQSLSQIASGGELSRFMLSLQAVGSDRAKVGTMIFDEIDAGISGKTAWSVAEKMALLSKEKQIIAITHLPQIASMADEHYLISKNSIEGSTITDIAVLDDKDKLTEVARLMSSDKVTDTNISSAKELIERAKKYKKSL